VDDRTPRLPQPQRTPTATSTTRRRGIGFNPAS
jgi:hypothetical protein